MDEKKLYTSINGELKQISPSTITTTITHESTGESLDKIINENVPIKLTREEYKEKIASGEIKSGSNVLYEVVDEREMAGIMDGKITEYSTFSSKKIVEMITTLGSGGTIVFGDGGASKSKVITLDLSPDNWSDTKPYQQAISSEYISDDDIITVKLSDKLSDDEFMEQHKFNINAEIKRIDHKGNTLIFKAYGDKPTNHIILDAIIEK